MLIPPRLPEITPMTAKRMMRMSGMTTSMVVYISATIPSVSENCFVFSLLSFMSVLDCLIRYCVDVRARVGGRYHAVEERGELVRGDLFLASCSAWVRSMPRRFMSLTIFLNSWIISSFESSAALSL